MKVASPLKVAFIVGEFPRTSEAFVLNQITDLLDRGHDVDIYALDGKPDDITMVHPDVERYKLLERTHYSPLIPKNYLHRFIQVVGILWRAKPLDLGWLNLFNGFKYGKRALSFKLFYQAVPFLRQPSSYDIIHCQFAVYGLTAVLLKQWGFLNGKLITTVRGPDVSKTVQEQGIDVYKDLFEHGDFFLAICEAFRQRAIQLGCPATKIMCHWSGIDCQQYRFVMRHPSADGRVRVVTVGRLVEKKGVEYCIRAIAQLLEQNVNIDYTVIGDGPLLKPLRQLARSLKVDHAVHLVGWKPQDEIVDTLNQCQIFLATCVTDANGDQDAPFNTLKEAMALGMPIIVTDHGGLPELVNDGISGFVVPERDPGAIAKQLCELMTHPEGWAAMGQAGRAKVESDYDMAKQGDKLIHIYQQVLNSDSSYSPPQSSSIPAVSSR